MNSLLNPHKQAEDTANSSLRPVDLSHFIGQEQLRDQIVIALQAASQRREMLDHVILSGPPGTGKTTLARIIATSQGGPLIECTGGMFSKPNDVLVRLERMQPRSVLFIDEVHALKRTVEEMLYPAMEDGQMDLNVSGKQSIFGLGSLRKTLPPFTLVGATTQVGRLSAPLRDRFGLDLTFNLYDTDDLTDIVCGSAETLRVTIDRPAASVIASAARGTPRIANRLLRRVRDFAQVRGNGRIDTDAARQTLTLQSIDEHGLDEQDRRYLQTLRKLFDGGPAGVRAIAASMNVAEVTLEEVVEPYLLHSGLVVRSSQGRRLTAEGKALAA